MDEDATATLGPDDVRPFQPVHYRAGERVLDRRGDERDKARHPATVPRSFQGLHEVRFENGRDGREGRNGKALPDEWVPPERIKAAGK